MDPITKTTTLENKVANYKLIARDSLRMLLISPRLTEISKLEAELENTTKCKTELEHDLKVVNYDISKLDTEHPNYEKTKTRKEESIKCITEDIANHQKAIESIQKDIEEQKLGISKIENGETKVSLEDLNCLVDKMIKQDALNQVPCTCN